MVMCLSDLGCSVGTRVTRVTCIAQSKSALVSHSRSLWWWWWRWGVMVVGDGGGGG